MASRITRLYKETEVFDLSKIPEGKYLVQVVNENGEVLQREYLENGETLTVDVEE